MSHIIQTLGLAVLFLGIPAASSEDHRTTFVSPDHVLTAIVQPAAHDGQVHVSESRVEVRQSANRLIRFHDFSSRDGEHGYVVDHASWTPNSLYFVFSMRSSGGHSPMYAPIVFWSRDTGRFYQLRAYTADQLFSVSAPDKLKVSDWPTMKPKTISLRGLKSSEFVLLK
jgi:hypothetical protein